MAVTRKPVTLTPVSKSVAKPIAASAALPVMAKAESAVSETTSALPAPAPQGAEALMANFRDTQEGIRKAAEQGMEKTRDMYARMKGEADVYTSSLEASFTAARTGFETLNQKTLEAIKTHTETGLEHAKAVMAVRTPQDFFTLSTEFARKQMEAMADQSKEFVSHFQKIAAESSEPIKSVIARSAAA